MSQKAQTGDVKRIFISGAMGAAVTLILTVLLSAILALLISSGKIGEGSETVLLVLCAFFSSAVGAIVSRHKSVTNALPSALSSSLIAIIVRLIVALFSEKSLPLGTTAMEISAAMLAGSIMILMLPTKKKKRKH
jgi:FlaA1/EpsC-like NDP-sugar epimerase